MKHDSCHQALVRRGTALEIASVPTPSPEAGGLLIAPSFVGVCGTDLQILNGSRPDTAEILGHEGAGLILEAGHGAALSEGEYVVFNPSAQLPAGRILGHNVPGLFQRCYAVDAQAVSDGLVMPVETGLPPLCGALVEPLGGVIYAYELISRAVPNLRAAVIFGAGPIGLVFAEYLQQYGVRVLLVHTTQGRLDTAVQLGLVEPNATMTASDDLTERILAWNDGAPLDTAVICTSMRGAQVALKHAVAVLKDGGCVEMVTNFPATSITPPGITAEAIRAVRASNVCGMPPEGNYVTAEIAGRRIVFTGHRGTSREHFVQAMRVLRSRTSRYTAMITHILPLEDAAEAIGRLAHTRGVSIDGKDCIKAVVDLTAHSSS